MHTRLIPVKYIPLVKGGKVLYKDSSRQRVIVVAKTNKDAKRLIEALHDFYEVRYTEHVEKEHWLFSDLLIFDYFDENIVKKSKESEVPYIFLASSMEEVEKYSLAEDKYILKGPGYLNYLNNIVNLIVEKQQLERILGFEKEKYLSLVNSMGCGMLVLRKNDGLILFANKVAKEVLGYQGDGLIHMKLSDFVDSEKDDSQILSSEPKINLECKLQTHLGDKRDVRYSSSETIYGAERVIQFTFMDITLQKRNMKEIMLQWRFLDNAEEIAYATDEKGIIIYLNSYAAYKHGYRMEEMIGTDEKNYLSNAEQKSSINEKLDNTGRWEGKEEHIRNDKTTFIVDTKKSILHTDEGTYVLTIGRDVTEELELRRKLKFHSLFLQNISEIIIVINEKNEVLYLNEVAKRFFRIKDNDISSINSKDNPMLTSFLENFFEKLKLMQNRGTIDIYEKGDTKITLEYAFQQILEEESNNFLGYIVTAKDMTEFYTMLEKVKERAVLLDHLHDLVIASDMKGCILYANNSWLKEHGYESIEEVKGKKLSDGIVDIDEQLRNTINEHLANKGIWRGKMLNYTKEGNSFTVKMTIVRLKDEDGYFIGDVGIIPSKEVEKKAGETNES
ncbi:MAG: PAS domain-containing protein [Kosmotoga sp.]|nr:MAG: PAS domain-containing protein [Kosmotoga sp.]